MAKLVAIYRTPKDPAAFDRYYAEKHVPIARKIPGLRHFDISRGAIVTPAGSTAAHLIATLTFDSLAAIEAALATPEGKAAAGDIANFADGGVELHAFDTADV